MEINVKLKQSKKRIDSYFFKKIFLLSVIFYFFLRKTYDFHIKLKLLKKINK